MAPARRSSRKTGATSTPPLSTPGSQPARQTTLKFSKTNMRQPSTPEARPKKKHLLDLPAELRLMIYKQMFPCGRVDVYAIKGSLHKGEDQHYVAGEHLAILTVCRMIYIEAKPVLYHSTEFCIHIRGHYWLHLWTKESYEEMFDVEDYVQEPDALEWNELTPWVQDPCSIVPLDNIRILTLAAECSTSVAAYMYTWTGQLKHTLRTASNIQKLHIELKLPYEDSPDQHTTNFMFELFGYYIQCRGPVTAEMDLALGSTDFDSESYYKMLDKFKGVDKTYDLFSSQLADLQSQHAKALQQLRDKVCSLRSKTEERIKFTESQATWVNYNTTKAISTMLQNNIEGTLREMVDHESKLQGLEKETALLQRRFESLKVRNKT